jgi:hypothetical protein
LQVKQDPDSDTKLRAKGDPDPKKTVSDPQLREKWDPDPKITVSDPQLGAKWEIRIQK